MASPDADRELPVCVALVVQRWATGERLGGAERQIESLVPLLVDRGVRPVIVGRTPGRSSTSDDGGLEVVHVGVPAVPGLGSIVFTWRASRVLRTLRPDVVHAFGAFAPSTLARRHKRSTGTPFLVKILRSGPLGDLQRLAAKPFGRRRLHQLTHEADGFAVISHEIDAELAAAGVGPDRRIAIPNGVDLRRFRPSSEEERAAERAELGARGRVVVAVGRLSPEKRLRELSERWDELTERHPDATLVVFGKLVNRVDPEDVRLADHPNVVHVGARPDIERGYRAADVYVSASVAEGLSNALLEAMASGVPCVVTDVGGVRDLIETGVNGVIVPPDDIAALLAALDSVLSDPEHAAELGARARETVAAAYSLESVADRLVATYRAFSRRSEVGHGATPPG